MNDWTRDEMMTVAAARRLWNGCVCFVGIGLPSAACIIPLPEIFSYFLQAGRVDVGFLGAAQVDRYGNLNSTVIGPYASPATRLPGAGGASEIAAHARQTFVMVKATPRSLVERLDFRTSAGFLEGHGARARAGMRGAGPQALITDFGVLTPEPGSEELVLSALFADAAVEEARKAVGWPLRTAVSMETIAPPTTTELDTLRALHARTREAHSRPVRVPA